MNRQEVSLLIDELKLVFDIVRLVDVTRTSRMLHRQQWRDHKGALRMLCRMA